MEDLPAGAVIIRKEDLDLAEQELMALDEPLPEHTVAIDSDTGCERCTLVALYAVSMVKDRQALPN